jgi:hypothetical protein
VTGDSRNGHAQPLDAALDGQDGSGRWLEHDGGVGAMPALDRRMGARATRLLVDDGLEDDVATQLQAAVAQRAERTDAGGDARLHVAAPAAPEAAVDDLAGPRVVRPE